MEITKKPTMTNTTFSKSHDSQLSSCRAQTERDGRKENKHFGQCPGALQSLRPPLLPLFHPTHSQPQKLHTLTSCGLR